MLEYNQSIFDQIRFALPDIFIGLSFLSLIIIRLIFNEHFSRKIFSKVSIIFCLIGGILSFSYSLSESVFSNTLFFYDKTVYFLKTILMFFSFCASLILCFPKIYKDFDCIIYMMMFGIISSLMLCISANNFLILFLGIEGVVISSSFLLMLNQKKEIKKQNAIKYLVLNAIASGIFLYGISLYYAEFNTLCFSYINNSRDTLFIIGTILVITALLFEIHAAPFHSWVIDIYEKTSTMIVAFFDTVFIFFMFFIFAKIISVFVSKGVLFFRPFLYFVSICSMLIGGIMPMMQKNIKKFIAFSSVGHIGFAISVFAVANYATEFKFSMLYITAYVVSSICFFFALFSLKRIKKVDNFSDFTAVIKDAPIIGYSIVLAMFSMIGLPPFINFIAKLNIMSFLIEKQAWELIVCSFVYTVLSFFYTVKVTRYLFISNNSTTSVVLNKRFYLLIIPLSILLLGAFISTQIEFSFSKVFTRIS